MIWLLLCEPQLPKFFQDSKISLRFGLDDAICQKPENKRNRFVSVKTQKIFSKLQKYDRENSKGLFLFKPANMRYPQRNHIDLDTPAET